MSGGLTSTDMSYILLRKRFIQKFIRTDTEMKIRIKDKAVMTHEARDAGSGLTFIGNGIPKPASTPPPISL